MKTRLRTSAWTLFAITALSIAGCGASANPLIGSWRLSGETPNKGMPGVHCQITRMEFTTSSTTSYDPDANPALAVRYVADAKRVIVSSQGGDVIYYVLDANHVQRDDWFRCTYVRH